MSFFGQKLAKRLDTKSDLLKTTLPRIRQLCGLEEENQKLKEECLQLKSAARGMYPDPTASLYLFLLCVDFVTLHSVQEESLSLLAAELERLQKECQALKDSESKVRAELEGISPAGAIFFFNLAFG